MCLTIIKFWGDLKAPKNECFNCVRWGPVALADSMVANQSQSVSSWLPTALIVVLGRPCQLVLVTQAFGAWKIRSIHTSWNRALRSSHPYQRLHHMKTSCQRVLAAQTREQNSCGAWKFCPSRKTIRETQNNLRSCLRGTPSFSISSGFSVPHHLDLFRD